MKIKLCELANVELSSIDKKIVKDELPVKLCNFTDVYYNWAITEDVISSCMDGSVNEYEYQRLSLKKGQVAITKDSETRDDIGISCYIADNFENAVLGYHCALITPNSKSLNGKYLNALLNTAYARKYFENQAGGSGQRYTLSKQSIENIKIPLPSIQIQKKLGDFFSDIDKKIQNNRKQIETLEALAKTIYDYWFVQFDFPNEEGKPYKSSGGKMIWCNELKREIPHSWHATTLKNKIKFTRGFSYSSDALAAYSDYPMINLANIDRQRNFKDSDLKFLNEPLSDNRYNLAGGEMLIACTDLTRKAEIIGCPIIVPKYGKIFIFSMDLAKLEVTNEEFEPYFLYMTLRTAHYHDYIKKWASGTNVLHLDLSGIERYKTIAPPLYLQKKYASLIEVINNVKSNLLVENLSLNNLKRFILPLLMNGQVKIKDN